LSELEKAKREFSAAFTRELLAKLDSVVPSRVLEMRAADFVKTMENGDDLESQMVEPMEMSMKLKTPIGSKHPFKSVKTPSGVRMQIPATISTRVDGAVLKSRDPRKGEVLFSMHGTPVLIEK